MLKELGVSGQVGGDVVEWAGGKGCPGGGGGGGGVVWMTARCRA